MDQRAFEQRAAEADKLVAQLTEEIQRLRQAAEQDALKRLAAENEVLKKQVQEAKENLRRAEIANGKPQFYIPGEKPVSGSGSAPSTKFAPAKAAAAAPAPAPASAPTQTTKEDKKGAGKKGASKESTDAPAASAETKTAPAAASTGANTDKKDKGKKKEVAPAKDAAPAAEERIDVSRVSFRVGRVVSVKRHPDAEKLYLEEVDLGEGAPRIVLSGLVEHIPAEQLQNRLVVLCTNLKPRKMQGIESQAMIMCANDGARVEIIDPPAGSVPGDRIEFPDYPGTPDQELNPKKKIFEAVQPDLKTNADLVATYKGSPFTVKGKGVCKVQSLANCGIK